MIEASLDLISNSCSISRSFLLESVSKRKSGISKEETEPFSDSSKIVSSGSKALLVKTWLDSRRTILFFY